MMFICDAFKDHKSLTPLTGNEIEKFLYKNGRCGMIVNETAIHQKQTKFKLLQVM